MKTVKTTGRTFNIAKINFALVYDTMVAVQTAGYNQVANLSGPDYQTMIDALKEAGFVGENTLINPDRVCAWEDAGQNARVYLEGADRVLHMPMDVMETLSGAGKGASEGSGDPIELEVLRPVLTVTPAEKPSKKKKAE